MQLVQEEQADRGDARAQDGEDLPPAGAADDLAGAGGGDQHADDHGQHVDAGHRRRDALDDLEEGRQVDHRAEHGEADDEADHRAEGEGADPEQLERQHGFGRLAFHEDEGDEQDGAEHGQADDLGRAPGPGGAAEGGDEHEAGGDGGDEEGAEVVDGVLRGPRRDAESGGDHGERDEPDGEVDVEDPAPGQVVDEQSAEQRAEHAGRTEDRAEEALVLAAFPGRDDVADDRHRQHDQPAASEALQGAEADELGHVLGEAAEGRADEEEDDGVLEELLSPVLVAELAPQRGGRGGGEHVGGDDPGEVGHAAELADDGRQGGGDDGLVECGDQQAQQQGADGDDHLAGCVLACGSGRVRTGTGVHGLAGHILSHPFLLRPITSPS